MRDPAANRATRFGRVFPAAVLAAALAMAATASGGGIRDHQDGWLHSPGWMGDFLAGPGGSGNWSGSAPRPVRGGGCGWLALGAGSLFGMPELPQQSIAARFRAAGIVWSLGCEQLGSGPYRESRLECCAVCGLGGKLLAGPVCALETATVGRECFSRIVVDGLAVRAEPAPGLAVDVRLRTAAPPSWHAGRGRYRLATVSGKGGFWGWALGCDRGEGPLRMQAGLVARLDHRVGVGVRADPATGTCGWTTCWMRGGLLVRTSHLVHPALGATHRWQVAWLPGRGN